MKIKIRNLLSGLYHQFPIRRFYRNFFVTRNGWGLFSKNSHWRNGDRMRRKVSYPTYESGVRASERMEVKTGKNFSVYKCIYCDGWHIGKTEIINESIRHR